MPKNQLAESTQQKIIKLLLSSQKIFKMSNAESITENFQIFIKHDQKPRFEVRFKPLHEFLW